MLQPNIGFTLPYILVVFMRSAITPPKVNRFGWNLKHSEYIAGGWHWPWQILGLIGTVVKAGEPGEILFLFLSHKQRTISLISCWPYFTKFGTTCWPVSRWKLLEQNFENFTIMGRFPPKHKYLKNVKCVFRLQAARTPQLLQMAGKVQNNPLRRLRGFHFAFLGRLWWVILIKSVSNVCSCMRSSVRLFIHKQLFNFSDIWYVGIGRWVMHKGMQYDPIQGQSHRSR